MIVGDRKIRVGRGRRIESSEDEDAGERRGVNDSVNASA